MPSAPQTWTMLQALQARIFNEVLVGGVSPFSTWNTTDQARFGVNSFATGGQVTTAIYIGVPKDWAAINYLPKQCHIIPPTPETVHRRNLGGHIWDEAHVSVFFRFSRKQDWYQAQQDLIAARDAAWPIFLRHAELPNAPTVSASNLVPQPAGQTAYSIINVAGEDFDQWGFTFYLRQEWSVASGIVP